MLDVAAVAERLWHGSALGGLPKGWRQAILFLVALHDLGKVSAAFRQQIEAGAPPPDGCRHWQLTAWLLQHHETRLAGLLAGPAVARRVLGDAVAGHHGRPPASDPLTWDRRRLAVGDEAAVAAGEVIEAFAPHFPGASFDGLEEAEAKRLSWLVSGLTVEADWIGSNSGWFDFTVPDLEVGAYWALARARAKVAVARAGLARSAPSALSPEALVDGTLRPMQRAVAEVALPEGPCLVLIEDATGAGKTEAALILAHRMIAAGKGGGVYFALPTMATADAMFARLRPMLGRMFKGEPSLALLHGKRMLSEGFAEVRRNAISRGDRPEDAACAAWIADDRRLALLAEVGVGTIDQALMAVLPTRFSTLRLAALATRVLVVDEAHSYDPYVEAELRGLLRAQGRLGGSAVVMTATLPRATRDGLVAAFREGLGLDKPRFRKRPSPPALPGDYPALSIVARGVDGRRVDPVPATCREVAVERLPGGDAALSLLADAAGRGAACAWVRNAVDEAVAAVVALRARGVEADLLHARFALWDRQAIEERVLKCFGKHRPSNGGQGPGRVLVATQVIESSLDLDFDVMVSDLAPMGALIQRAGRLWRHMDLRPAGDRPPGPTLHVLSPDPGAVEGARWAHPVLGAGAWVYPQDVLWRTADALFLAGAIRAPEGLRRLIEAVHGEDGNRPPLPDALLRAEQDTRGRAMAEAGAARRQVVDIGEGYASAENVFADDVFPTRLGEEQATLVLARRQGSTLRWWADDPDPRRAEALSEVQAARRRVRATTLAERQAGMEVMALTKGWKDWQRATRLVAVVGEDGTVVDGVRYDRGLGLVLPPSGG